MTTLLDANMTWRAPLIAISIALFSCSPTPNSGNNSGKEEESELVKLRREALASIGEHVILATYEDVVVASEALASASEAWKASPSDATRADAQAAWKEAMTAWQGAELYQVGPAGVMGDVAGGEDLRDQIYSWPLVNPCRVDQEIVAKNYEDADAFASQIINVRGLDALEYLLFVEGSENACKVTSSINADGSWAALDEEELDARRAAYAATLSANLVLRANALVSAWKPGEGEFLEELSGAGVDSKTYANSQEALNALSDALFYIEKETKDMKLAIPVGIGDCDTETCPEALEHPWADFSKEAARANMLAFKAAYFGNRDGEPEQTGFDDLLISLGEESLDAEMKARIDAAIVAIDAIDGSLGDALGADLDKARAAYDAYKAVGDLLKTQFVSVLDLELPQRAEGDND